MYLLEAVSRIYLYHLIDILIHGLLIDVFIRSCFPHIFTLFNRYFN
jgi:hypothetical protein